MRFRKKFNLSKEYVHSLFTSLEIKAELDQLAILVFGLTKNYKIIGGGRVVPVAEFIKEIHQNFLNGALLKNQYMKITQLYGQFT